MGRGIPEAHAGVRHMGKGRPPGGWEKSNEEDPMILLVAAVQIATVPL